VGPLDDDDGGLQHFYPSGDDTRAASASVPLDATNKGYQLLQKLGWRQGTGLGRNEDGERFAGCG
jgi:hypothetical protein